MGTDTCFRFFWSEIPASDWIRCYFLKRQMWWRQWLGPVSEVAPTAESAALCPWRQWWRGYAQWRQFSLFRTVLWHDFPCAPTCLATAPSSLHSLETVSYSVSFISCFFFFFFCLEYPELASVLEIKNPGCVWWGFVWEGGSRGRGYMYVYSWFTSLYSRNWQNIVKQLSSNLKK